VHAAACVDRRAEQFSSGQVLKMMIMMVVMVIDFPTTNDQHASVGTLVTSGVHGANRCVPVSYVMLYAGCA
jgi:hypothetical protein